MKVVVVEDDPRLASLLARIMADEGDSADTCATGAEGVQRVRSGVYDLAIVDWMLPGGDGLFVCRELRRAGCALPVLMLTARGEVRDRVLGLEAGADDYLVKPFEVAELLARARALVRRSRGFDAVGAGGLLLDRVAGRARLHAAPLDLTTREYALLLCLVEHAGGVVPRASLLEKVRGGGADADSNLLDVHISRLRDKLGAHAWMIETVRGSGYRFRAKREPGG